jgi:hypothetical protein
MKTLISLLLLTFLIVNFGCDSSTNPPNAVLNKSIVGTVKDIQGNLISDAKIFIIYDFGQPDPPGSLKKLCELNSVVLDGPFTDFDNNGIKLYWTTYSETNNQGFEIERKSENTAWTTIGFLDGKGTTTDTSYYEYIDPYIGNGIYTFRLKIMEFNGSYEYSGEVNYDVNFLPNESTVYQNYPNPFDVSTTIHFKLRKPAQVGIYLVTLKNQVFVPPVFKEQLGPGDYEFVGEFYDSLPSNGYKVSLEYIEEDTVYHFWLRILQSYHWYEPSILSTKPNAVTLDGVFEIFYEDLPIGEEFIHTTEASPEPVGVVEVGNKLTLVIYKPGYKVIQKDVTINLDQGQEIEIVLEDE